MATDVEPLTGVGGTELSSELAGQWRTLARAATIVALLSAPAIVVWLNQTQGWAWYWSILAALGAVIAFRGLVDLAFHRMIPWPSLFGVESQQLREEDVVARRRVWFWRFWLKVGIWLVAIGLVAYLFHVSGSYFVQILPLLIIFPFYMLMNFAILFGPLLFMNLAQIQAFEPGDAEWGVKLADVRGQVEAKEDVRRVVSIWQSGEAFERAGGKRERGLLFLGAPGTGKTMLAKALATGFNSPFISIPGSGFAATFIGIDAIVVRILARRAKRLARKWGGQCIVFIDEIDAVGRRRDALGGHGVAGGHSPAAGPPSLHDLLFYGQFGALNPSGDLILENRQWREKLFAQRAPERAGPGFGARLSGIVYQMFPGMFGGGGSLALNQLLVVMDGIDNPPFFRKFSTNKLNAFLDGIYIVPRRIGKRSFRLPAAKPRREQIYFIGATNVPIDVLDPALTRPGRMGRHVWFRTPTKQDRLDILELYIGKVAHSPELDQANRREEIARVTNGYSPAMLEQVTSMALSIAHHSGRTSFAWDDLVEAMTTLEAGTAVGIDYVPAESRAVAIHEAGHAAAGHVYLKGAESTRLSIRMRGGALGHHQALEKEERFSRFRSEEFARLVWALGAMAAERVFYGENSNGVGGDVQSVTAQAAYMVGASAMGPQPFEVSREGRERRGGARAGAQALREDRPSDHEPHRRRGPVQRESGCVRARGPGQACPRGRAHRPGVRRRVQPRSRQSRRRGAHRHRAAGAPRDLRGRAAEPARDVEDPDSGRRPLGGERVADDVSKIATGAQPPSSPPAVAGTKPARVDSRAERARRAAYRSRFALLYVLLAIVAGGALGALVVLVSRGSPSPAAAWSSFQPTGTNDQKVAQIAANVGARYRLPSGDQLATITAGAPSVTGADGTSFRVNAIAVQPDTSRGQADASDISAVNAAGTVMYQLCGLGNSCSIPEGKATVARGTLLRREALELALYTFKYVKGTDSVLVLIPPRPDGKLATAVFLEHSDVAPELQHPLSATLSAPLTPGIGEISAAELRAIERITRPRLYTYRPVQGQDGSPIMVLTPVLGS